MPYQRVGIGTPVGAQGSRNSRGDATAYAPVRHHLHEHDNRKGQGDPGERIGPKEAHEIRLDDTDQCLDDQHNDRRQGQAEHSRGDRAGKYSGREVGDGHGSLTNSSDRNVRD